MYQPVRVRQNSDPSFLERLGLLVDLARCLHAAKLKGTSVEDIDLSLFTGIRQKGNQPTSGF